jgi:hypothetical protein
MIDKPVPGVVTDARTHPAGKKGARISLEEVAERAWKARMSPRLRAWVTQQLDKCGCSTGGRREKAACILDAFRKKVPYVHDPVLGEFMATPDQLLCLDEGGLCIIGGDCFPEGTLLLRDDHALVPIEQIEVGQRIWGRDKWSTVTQKWAKGSLTVDAVDLSTGSTMHLTRDHKVYVGRCKHGQSAHGACSAPDCRASYERIHLGDLQEGEVLLQPERIDFGSGHVDPERMYIEALALADGWTQASKNPELPHVHFRIAGRDGKRKEAQKREVQESCARLGIETRWHRRYIEVKDRAWASRIAMLGSRARFKHLETIGLDEETAQAALRGLMADSTQNTGAKTRTFSTTSRQLMVQVRVLHRMLGRMTGVRMLTPEQHGGAGKHPLWRVGQREKFGMVATVRSIERAVRKIPCWDISTDDHYVYLPEHDVTVSNCDEASITLAAACLCIGIPAAIVGSSQREPVDLPTHVFMAFQDDLGDWVRMDGTTKLAVGRTVPHMREWWFEPGEKAKETGQGDFVGMSGTDIAYGGVVGVSGAGGVRPVSKDRVGLAFPGLFYSNDD